MTSGYRLSEEASLDVKEIHDYLLHNADAISAKRVSDRLKSEMKFLSRTPGAGQAREDLTSKPFRFWPVFSYFIIYYADSKPIEIVRVLHAKRHISKILKSDYSGSSGEWH